MYYLGRTHGLRDGDNICKQDFVKLLDSYWNMRDSLTAVIDSVQLEPLIRRDTAGNYCPKDGDWVGSFVLRDAFRDRQFIIVWDSTKAVIREAVHENDAIWKLLPPGEFDDDYFNDWKIEDKRTSTPSSSAPPTGTTFASAERAKVLLGVFR